MSFKNETANLHATIRHLVLLNAVFAIAMLASTSFNFLLYRGLSVSVPPDLRAGVLLAPGQKQPEDVFTFTASVFQAIQHWRSDGERDYPNNIEQVSAFITQNFTNQLTRDRLKKDQLGELRGITRQLALPVEYIFEDQAVRVINSNQWIVKMPLEIKEYVDGELIKDIEVLYSFVVKRVRTNVTENAHQIQIDGFYQAPIRTKDFLSEEIIKQDVVRLLNEL